MNVKQILSGAVQENVLERSRIITYYRMIASSFRQKAIDKLPVFVIIIFTWFRGLKSEAAQSAASEKQTRQARDLTATRNLQSPPARCNPSAVSGQRVLRCPRLGPSEIRDAATGPCGQEVGFTNGQGVWFLAAVVLPSRIQFRAKWPVRIAAWEAWPEKWPQTHSGSDEIRSRAADRGSVAGFRSARGGGEPEVRLAGASPQHRAAASAGKKTPLSPPSPFTPAPPDQDGLVAAYEDLRSQFLSGQRGPGLALFLRRGMRELMNICSLSAAPPALPTVANDAVLPQGVRTDVVLILAGMLLHRCQELRS
jgi:hypothetical protein